MAEQMTLFDFHVSEHETRIEPKPNGVAGPQVSRPPARSRESDPLTSVVGAHSFDATRARESFVAVLRAAGPGVELTANEIAARAVPETAGLPLRVLATRQQTIRKRAKELLDAREISLGAKRECTITGKLATTYRIGTR